MIVCNASPSIALANLDRLDLLDRLFDGWYVPERVASECTVDRKPFAARLKAVLPGHVLTVSVTEPVRSLRLLVDQGEAEAIALAEEKSVPQVLMDDRKGRRVASARGLSVVGTVGVLLMAKSRGLIPSIRSVLEALGAAGIRVSTQLQAEALRIAGELTDADDWGRPSPA
jgi:predicted nucleic acid-binding protein